MGNTAPICEFPVRSMTAAEVADTLRCSIPTVHNLVHRGELIAIVFGRRTVFDPREVQRFIDQHSTRREAN